MENSDDTKEPQNAPPPTPTARPVQQQDPEEDPEKADVLLEDKETSTSVHSATQYYNMREVSFLSFNFNPVVSVIGAVVLWGLAVFCLTDDSAAGTLTDGMLWITESFTWFYIGTKDLWIVFLIYVYVYYGDRKLGRDDEKPVYDNISYFAMIFSAGIGVDLFYFGMAEPMGHYIGVSRYAADPGESQNELSQNAINLTLFHWGLHGWCVYSILACLMAFMSYRKGLPLTIRSCFYPLLGDHTWGYIGDVIDGVSIVTIIAGVCTSLGIGAAQILEGLIIVGLVDEKVKEDEDDFNLAQLLVIWSITLMATASVVSGLDRGIKLLSQIAFGIGVFLIIAVVFLDSTWFLLNLIVQSTGFYFQWLIQVGFWTDAFAQLETGEGAAIVSSESADPLWFGWWTMFYWGWWVAWSPFVGAFLARISRGRTIRQVVNYTMTVPMAFMIVWFSVFGGAGIRMHRRAEELMALGETLFDDSSFFQIGETACFEVPSGFENNETTMSWDHSVSPVCTEVGPNSWFDVMYQYGPLGRFLSVISLLGMIFYFVTSADSGALVVDTLASNGREDHSVIQRIVWAATIGAVATALLIGAGENGLGALQSASLIVGLPYTMFLMMMAVCFYRALKADKEGEKDGSWPIFTKAQFTMPIYGGVFDIFESLIGGGISDGRGAVRPTVAKLLMFVTAVGAPFIGLLAILTKENGNKNGPNLKFAEMGTFMGTKAMFNLGFTLVTSFFFYTAVVMVFLGAADAIDTVFINFGLVFYTIFAGLLTFVRFMIRNKYAIGGNIFEDFFGSWILYPQVISQLTIQALQPPVVETVVEQSNPEV